MLLGTALCGVVTGVIGGIALTRAFRKFLVPDNLQGVCALSIGLLLFAVSDHIAHESGLIAVTVMGIWLSNQRHFDVEHIIEFKENLRTLLIGCLFIVLGSRVNFSDVIELGWPGIAFLLLLIVIVRPLSVFVSLMGTSHNLREQAFIAGLRRAGSSRQRSAACSRSRWSHSPNHWGFPRRPSLIPSRFSSSSGPSPIYGLTASPLAKRLGLAEDKSHGVLIAGADAWTRDFAKELKECGVPVLLVDTNFTKITNARISGIDAVCGNILNEHLRDELTLTGIGQMMAMTPNDEVNSLAVRECRTMFDRAHLYQLSFNTDNQHSRRGLTENLLGRVCSTK